MNQESILVTFLGLFPEKLRFPGVYSLRKASNTLENYPTVFGRVKLVLVCLGLTSNDVFLKKNMKKSKFSKKET